MKEYSSPRYKRKVSSRQRRRMWGYLRPAEIVSLDKAIESRARDRVMFRLMYRCGLRVGEVVGEEYHYEVRGGKVKAKSVLPGIMTHDIDFGAKSLLVHGKGDLNRTVPLPDRVVDDIRHYLARYRGWDRASNVQLIVSHGREEPIGTHNVRGIWRRMKKDIGLRENVRVHDLRHTYAMEYLRAGGDPRDLKNLMGHSSLDITMMYVERLEEETNVAARAVLNKITADKDETGDDE